MPQLRATRMLNPSLGTVAEVAGVRCSRGRMGRWLATEWLRKGEPPMLGRKTFTPHRIHPVSREDRVPADHLLRRIATAVDFSFVRRLTARYYSTIGQPGIDPVVLFTMALIGYLSGI